MLLSDLGRMGNIFNTWHEMDRLHREMNRLFSGRSLPFSREYPAINLWSSGDNVIVIAEIPGIDSKDLDISVEGDILTVSGVRGHEELTENEKYHRQERPHGRFRRNVRLPFRVDPQKVDAVYEKGIVKITLPRLEQDKPKKISIKTE